MRLPTPSGEATAGDIPNAEAPIGVRIRAGAWLVRRVVEWLGRSYRVEWVGGRDVVTKSGAEPWVICFWHDSLPFFSWWLRREMARSGRNTVVLASQSLDGEIAARITRSWGGRVVRGSSSRGGSAGLRALYRAMRNDRNSTVLIPDGPRGPRHRFQPGALFLARLTGAPVVLMHCRPRRAWRLGSWDRMIVPLPFSRIRVTVETPCPIPPQASLSQLETIRRELETRLAAVQP